MAANIAHTKNGPPFTTITEVYWRPLIPFLKRCLGKLRWPDEISARAMALRMSLREGEVLEAYRCGYCRHWHTGRANKHVKDGQA